MNRGMLGALLVLAARPVAAQDVWALFGVQVPVVSPVSLRATGFVLTDVDLHGGWVELRTAVTPWLTLTPALLRSKGTIEGVELSEWRPRFDASVTAAAAGIRLTSRNMLERRHIRTEREGDTEERSLTMLRLRLRAELNRPVYHVAPFATIEYFRDLGVNAYVRSWVTGGVSLTMPHWQFEPAYLRRLERNGPDADAFQLSLTWYP